MAGSISAPIAELLAAADLDPADVQSVITRAIDEDLDGGQDVTTVATVPIDQRSTLDLVARSNGVVAGVPVAAAVFDVMSGDAVSITMHCTDGEQVAAGQTIISIIGPTHELLRAERPALNLLGRLSGIATLTQTWVRTVADSQAQVRDTRKTTPGLRKLEKYAVRCGGGVNHRMSLSDAALVKDNHVVAAGGVAQAFAMVRTRFPNVAVEVEVDSLDQLDEVLRAGADLVLLDNFTVPQMQQAVERNAGRAKLEASGGLSLDAAAQVAATGVDYLAVGALTHSAPVLDRPGPVRWRTLNQFVPDQD